MSHSKEGLTNTPTDVGKGVSTRERDAGSRFNMPQPESMMQHCCVGDKEGWDLMLLHQLLPAQCTHEEGFISTFIDPGGDWEPHRSGSLLSQHEVRFLSGQDGWGIKAVYGFHHWKPWILQVSTNAIWALQCSSNLLMTHAELLRWAEPDILSDLSWLHDCLLINRRGASTLIACCVWLISWA